MEDIIRELRGRKIAIYGFGREGKSTYKIIRKYLKSEEILIMDKNINSIFEESKMKIENDKKTRILADENLKVLEEYDLIFKTPGISFNGKKIDKIKGKITSQLQMFLKYAKVYTIGVTGTKGKSTTSSLIYQILKDQEKKTCLIGNIGVPVFEEIENIEKMDYAVIEISAHQLEFIHNSPNIAVLLNLFEEHLDHFGTYQKYINAKLNIFRFQEKKDFAVYNTDSKVVVENVDNLSVISNKMGVATKTAKKQFTFDFNEKRYLIGKHNEINIMFALTVAKILRLNENQTNETIYEFKSLPHRMEFIGKFNGVDYYNDSISTIPEATIACVNSIKNTSTVIIGGLDRGVSYNELIQFLQKSNLDNIICMSTTGKKIYDIIKDKCKANVEYFETLEECVKKAKEVTIKNKACIFSPAAASYNMFKNFEQRGDAFKALVKS
ncbi:MAG: UDP-N-acetylmuramoyl-L-alanine--D-glutamate ligase [Clostridia bacterium]